MSEIAKLKDDIEKIESSLASGDQNALVRGVSSIQRVIALLDTGVIRVCEKSGETWQTNAWIKQAILFYFRTQKMERFEVGPFVYLDKIPLKRNFEELKVRVVPPATARFGSFLEPGVILMPSYVNIGAYVGENSMVDTWATVGSCAQIGKNVHLSGGVGIGGVLEPPSAQPVIVEDGAFVGSRCIIVEGVRVGAEAVLGSNVTLTASTPIIDTRDGKLTEFKGHVPPRCVVVPGVKEKKMASGVIHTQCAYIIGERKPSTDLKTSLNAALRDYSVSV